MPYFIPNPDIQITSHPISDTAPYDRCSIPGCAHIGEPRKPTHMKSLIIISSLTLAVASLSAQSLTTEITVDRTVRPEQIAAAPLQTAQPQTLLPTPFGGDLTLSHYDGAYGLHAMPDSISTGTDAGLPETPATRGYATVGYFPLYRLMAQAGYRFIDTPKTLLTASARYGGYSYHDQERGDNKSVTNNNFDVNARFGTLLGSHRLDIQADLGIIGIKHPTGTSDVQTQCYTSACALLTFGRDTRRYGYGIKLGVDYLGTAKDVVYGALTQNVVSVVPAEGDDNTIFDGTLYGHLKTSEAGAVSLDARVRHLNCGSYCNPTIYTFTPAYTYSKRAIRLRVGLNVNIAIGSNDYMNDDIVRILPAFDIAWQPTERVCLYGRYNNGMEHNSLRERLNYSVFAPAVATGIPVRAVDCDAEAGLRVGRPDALRISLRSGYRDAGAAQRLTYDYNVPTYISFDSGDTSTMLWGEAGVGYTVKPWYELSIDACVRLNQEGEGHYATDTPDRAGLICKVRVSARPLSTLTVGLGFEHRGSRRCYGYGEEYIDLGDVNDLSIDGIWRYSSTWTFTAAIDNILGKRHSVLPGLSSPGITGLVSATCRF